MWPRSALLLRGEHRQLLRQPVAHVLAQPEAVLHDTTDDPAAWLCWQAEVHPAHGALAGGVFAVDLTFPPSYDEDPPDIVFRTVPYHPNVHPDSGRLSLPTPWTSATPLAALLAEILALLVEPHAAPEACAHPAARKAWLAATAGERERQTHTTPNDTTHAALDGSVDAGLYKVRARACVEASRRVRSGLTPHEGIDPNPNPFELALASLPRAPTWDEAQQEAAARRRTAALAARPPCISFSEYRRGWEALGTARASSSTEHASAVQARTGARGARAGTGAGTRHSSHSDGTRDMVAHNNNDAREEVFTRVPSPSAVTASTASTAASTQAQPRGQGEAQGQGQLRDGGSDPSASGRQKTAFSPTKPQQRQSASVTIVVRQGSGAETRSTSRSDRRSARATHDTKENAGANALVADVDIDEDEGDALLAWTDTLDLAEIEDDSSDNSGSEQCAAAAAVLG